jgi:hypothetical protein
MVRCQIGRLASGRIEDSLNLLSRPQLLVGVAGLDCRDATISSGGRGAY